MDDGVESLRVTGTAGGPVVMTVLLVDDVLGLVGRVGLGDDRPPEPEWTCAIAGPLEVGFWPCMLGAAAPPIPCAPPPVPRASAAPERSGIVKTAAAARGQA